MSTSVSNLGVIVLMPTRGTLCLETHEALSHCMDGVPNIRATVSRKPVEEARNQLAAAALHIAEQDPLNVASANYTCLWVDDDAWWPAGTIASMLRTMHERPEIDVLCANYSLRRPNSTPVAVPKGLADRINTQLISYGHEGLFAIRCDPGHFLNGDRIKEIGGGAGMHFVAHYVSVLQKVGPDPFNLGDNPAEDMAFYQKIYAAGLRVFCDTQLPVAHIEAENGVAFLPFHPPLRVAGGNLVLCEAGGFGGNLIEHSYGGRQDERIASIFELGAVAPDTTSRAC